MLQNCKKGEKASLVVLILLIFLANSAILCTKNVVASTGSGRVLDLFTQKTPFGGKGPNQPSDAFQPQELVLLYANVTYNGAAVAGKLVSFQVEGPTNEFDNLTVFGSGITSTDGLATFSFRVPWPVEHPEEIVFGTWFAVATVDIAQVTVNDTLTFRVGWILQITSIITLNSNLMPQTTFLRHNTVDFNLTVENIAMVEKTGTITIEAEDVSGHPIMNITKEDLTFEPGESYVIGSSQIPDTAMIGNATVWAAIYTALPSEGGVLYSPAISTQFEIAEKLLIHDIGIVSIMASPNSVYVGERVQIVVTVKNNGTVREENCVLSVYYNSSSIWIPIATLSATLEPGSQIPVTLYWDTNSVAAGLYRIKANISLPNIETDPSPGDNTLIGTGLVQLRSPEKPVPYAPSFPFLALFIIFMFILAIIASLILLLMLGYLRRRRRRRKKKLPRRYTIIVHPHI